MQVNCLKDNNLCADRAEFDAEFRALLLDLEDKYQKRWTIYTDTTSYDTVGLSAILMRSGAHPLVNMQSNGGYHPRSTYDIDSALCGRYGIVPGEDTKANEMFARIRRQFEDEKTVEHNHLPDNDAEHIAAEFLHMWEHAPPVIETLAK